MAINDSVLALERARESHHLAHRALEQAMNDEDRVMTSQVHSLLRGIEDTFPVLAVDIDAAATDANSA